MPVVMMSGREVRRVPRDYKHPTREEQHERGLHVDRPNGSPQPMFFKTYDEAIREWWEGREAWLRGERPDYFTERDGDPYTYEEYDGGPPDPAYYLCHPFPDDAEMGIQLWETVSEGTPISPVFDESDAGRREMAKWMAENDNSSILRDLDANGWLRLISGDAFGTDLHTGELV